MDHKIDECTGCLNKLSYLQKYQTMLPRKVVQSNYFYILKLLPTPQAKACNPDQMFIFFLFWWNTLYSLILLTMITTYFLTLLHCLLCGFFMYVCCSISLLITTSTTLFLYNPHTEEELVQLKIHCCYPCQ